MTIGEVLFNDLPLLFQEVIESFSMVLGWFTQSLSDIFNNVIGVLELPTNVVEAIEDIISSSGLISYIWNIPLIALMLGASIGIYLVYQFITWVLNVIT